MDVLWGTVDSRGFLHVEPCLGVMLGKITLSPLEAKDGGQDLSVAEMDPPTGPGKDFLKGSEANG